MGSGQLYMLPCCLCDGAVFHHLWLKKLSMLISIGVLQLLKTISVPSQFLFGKTIRRLFCKRHVLGKHAVQGYRQEMKLNLLVFFCLILSYGVLLKINQSINFLLECYQISTAAQVLLVLLVLTRCTTTKVIYFTKN